MKQPRAKGKDHQRPVTRQVQQRCCRLAGMRHWLAAMCPFGIDFVTADAAERKQCRNAKCNRHQEDRAIRDQVPGRSHARRGKTRTDGGKACVAAKPFTDGKMTDQTKADGGYARSEHATGGGVQYSRGNDDAEDRPCCVGKCAHADGDDRPRGHEALGPRRVDQRAARHLPRERNQPADGQDETDINLCPFLRRQIDGNKWTEAGLYIGEAENEPVQPAQALARGMRQPFPALQWRCCTRHAVRFGPATIEPVLVRARRHYLSDPRDIALVVGCASGACKITSGDPRLYSGANLTWSRVRSSVIVSDFRESGKCNALQSTATLRLPTPRNPPKSMTTPRTCPLRSTRMSMTRPMSSSALLRTFFPMIPSTS